MSRYLALLRFCDFIGPAFPRGLSRFDRDFLFRRTKSTRPATFGRKTCSCTPVHVGCPC